MGPYSFIYRAKTSKRSKNRHLEPWPSARVVVPSRWIEHLSSGYKSEVIAIILRRHIYWVGSQLLPNIHDCNLLGLLQEPSMPAVGFEPTQHQSLAYGAEHWTRTRWPYDHTSLSRRAQYLIGLLRIFGARQSIRSP